MPRDPNLIYCAAVLKSVITDVRRFDPTVRTAEAWVWKFKPGQWEFHFPGFYWHGSADNAYEARSAGWQSWLKYRGCPEYQDEAPEVEPVSCDHCGDTKQGVRIRARELGITPTQAICCETTIPETCPTCNGTGEVISPAGSY